MASLKRKDGSDILTPSSARPGLSQQFAKLSFGNSSGVFPYTRGLWDLQTTFRPCGVGKLPLQTNRSRGSGCMVGYYTDWNQTASCLSLRHQLWHQRRLGRFWDRARDPGGFVLLFLKVVVPCFTRAFQVPTRH
jgi:hypothetical protein